MSASNLKSYCDELEREANEKIEEAESRSTSYRQGYSRGSLAGKSSMLALVGIRAAQALEVRKTNQPTLTFVFEIRKLLPLVESKEITVADALRLAGERTPKVNVPSLEEIDRVVKCARERAENELRARS